jgi:CBS domain-containing protein
MQVREAMSNNVRMVHPTHSIRAAAQLMAMSDCGCLPVADGDRLVGIITDRDIAVRAVAMGQGPDTEVREVMSSGVKYCFDDAELDKVAHNMADIKVRRLPVLDHGKRLVGILSLGDIALTENMASAGMALCGISEPGGEHSQSDGQGMMRRA